MSKIVTIIESMTPQCPPHFRSEPHKITYLRNAVLGQQWARTPISNIVTAQYTFNGFVTALRESMQLEEEIKSARSDHRRPPPNCTFIQHYGSNPGTLGNQSKDGRTKSIRPPTRFPNMGIPAVGPSQKAVVVMSATSAEQDGHQGTGAKVGPFATMYETGCRMGTLQFT